MGRFLLFLLVFIIGGAVGFFVGGYGGVAAGSYLGACKVVDNAVGAGAMTQEEANAAVREAAAELGVTAENKQSIVDAIQRTREGQPETPCGIAIKAL
jgi:hypothetical protein